MRKKFFINWGKEEIIAFLLIDAFNNYDKTEHRTLMF